MRHLSGISSQKNGTAPKDSVNRLRGIVFGTNRLNIYLGVVAVVILLGSFSVLAYNTFNKENTNTITVNGKEYSYDAVFSDFPHKTLNEYEGVGLSDLVNDTGLKNPENHEYLLIGSDGYQKTVKWTDMENGILKLNKTSYFPDLPRQFYVKDLVKIEVI